MVFKVLFLVMIIVIIFVVFDLMVFIVKKFFFVFYFLFKDSLFEIFGLFLNILIVLEILENIIVYFCRYVF